MTHRHQIDQVRLAHSAVLRRLRTAVNLSKPMDRDPVGQHYVVGIKNGYYMLASQALRSRTWDYP
jgi:hypothetical protein